MIRSLPRAGPPWRPGPPDGETLESERLKARLGAMLLNNELLEQKITRLEGGRPLARRRWKP